MTLLQSHTHTASVEKHLTCTQASSFIDSHGVRGQTAVLLSRRRRASNQESLRFFFRQAKQERPSVSSSPLILGERATQCRAQGFKTRWVVGRVQGWETVILKWNCLFLYLKSVHFSISVHLQRKKTNKKHLGEFQMRMMNSKALAFNQVIGLHLFGKRRNTVPSEGGLQVCGLPGLSYFSL